MCSIANIEEVGAYRFAVGRQGIVSLALVCQVRIVSDADIAGDVDAAGASEVLSADAEFACSEAGTT